MYIDDSEFLKKVTKQIGKYCKQSCISVLWDRSVWIFWNH